MSKNTPQTKRVAILAYPQLCTFEFGCAIELFSLERLELPKCYDTDVVAIDNEPICATGGIIINTEHIFTALPDNDYFKDYDMIVIGGWSDINTQASEDLIASLKQFHNKGGTLVSFCAGAFVLAQTGLLNDKNATTHWMFADDFKKQFPRINFQDNVLFTQEDRIFSSAGSAAGLDLGLHIIRRDFGANISNKIAKRMVLSPQREGGQAQYATISSYPKKPNHLNKSMQWASNNLDKQISINEMAHRACLSRRSFDRHFRSKIGQSPKEWLIQQRLNLAREFLESSRIDIEQIALKSGFGTPMNLRHHFNQFLGITPKHYRNQFLK